MAEVVAAPPIIAPLPVRRWRTDDFIKAFFGSNALIAIVVLGLITIFLFREGFGFFGQNLRNIRLYRRADLEYLDIIRHVSNAHAAVSRGLLIYQLRENFRIVIVTHNMQQAGRCSNYTAFFYLGRLIEFGATSKIFSNPTVRQTEDYITGRFG
jgi:hypothetical protein